MPNITETWHKLRIIFFLGAVFLAIWAIWQVLNNIGYGWAVGPLVDRNVFAALMNLLWFPAVYLFLANKPPSNYKLYILLGIGLFMISTALFATSSRGGIGVWLILQPVMLWAGWVYTKSKQPLLIIICITIAAYLVSALVLNSSVADRTFVLTQDASTNARIMLWQSSIKMSLTHPFLGVGWGTFVGYYPAFRLPLENSTAGLFAHNDYLQFAVEGGVFAFLLLAGLLSGICLQLKRSLKRAEEAAGLESVALLLGVLAIFIQASVNFIFYFAFMNIIVGVYLARANQLVDSGLIIKIPSFHKIRPAVKRLLTSFVVLIIALPFAVHLFAQAFLTGSQPALKLIKLISPQLTDYQIASFISAIRPQEGIAQEAMLQVSEQFFADKANINKVTNTFKSEFLVETIARFDAVRARTLNNPNMGVREAKILIENQDMFSDGVAYTKAKQVLDDSLKADPYHAKSMIMYARLQVAEGKKTEAIDGLKIAQGRILTERDRQLIVVEILRQLAAPKIISELDDIEKQLALVLSDSETGKPLILPLNFSEDIDAKLTAIARQIEQAR